MWSYGSHRGGATENMQSLKSKIIQQMKLSIALFKQFNDSPEYVKRVKNTLAKDGLNLTEKDIFGASERKTYSATVIVQQLEKAQVVIFPARQASVFLDVIGKIDFNLDYILPFSNTLLQFDEPLTIDLADHDHDIVQKELGAILLGQDRDEYRGTTNLCFLIESDLCNFRQCFWGDFDDDLLPSHPLPDDPKNTPAIVERMTMIDMKNLAIACIGYINCENVYLHKEGEVSEAINAKRERKGKSRLEPYYVCRIRGVQYDSEGYEKGAGVKHGIRYDVRGHFRRLETGKTIWVRPHQRGLQNELYVPKTYVVVKEPHP